MLWTRTLTFLTKVTPRIKKGCPSNLRLLVLKWSTVALRHLVTVVAECKQDDSEDEHEHFCVRLQGASMMRIRLL